MIAWFKRMIHDERLEEANRRLDEQYAELREMCSDLDRLGDKLDHLGAGDAVKSTETKQIREQFTKTTSGQMKAVRLDSEEEDGQPAPYRRSLPSGV